MTRDETSIDWLQWELKIDRLKSVQEHNRAATAPENKCLTLGYLLHLYTGNFSKLAEHFHVLLWKFKPVWKINPHPWCIWEGGRRKQSQIVKGGKTILRLLWIGKVGQAILRLLQGNPLYCHAKTSYRHLQKLREVLEKHLGGRRSILPRDSAVTNVHSWILRSSGA